MSSSTQECSMARARDGRLGMSVARKSVGAAPALGSSGAPCQQASTVSGSLILRPDEWTRMPYRIVPTLAAMTRFAIASMVGALGATLLVLALPSATPPQLTTAATLLQLLASRASAQYDPRRRRSPRRLDGGDPRHRASAAAAHGLRTHPRGIRPLPARRNRDHRHPRWSMTPTGPSISRADHRLRCPGTDGRRAAPGSGSGAGTCSSVRLSSRRA